MGIKERREREKQYVRTMILKIVNRIVTEEGWNGVTIRKIAEEIEYSPPIIYEHFDSKEALLQELTREAFEKFLKIIQKEVAKTDNPVDLLHIISDKYYDFCIANPGYAKAIFGLDGVPSCVHINIEEFNEVMNIGKQIIARCINCSDLNDPKVFEAVNYYRWITRGAISAAVSRLRLEEKDAPFDNHEKVKAMIRHALDCIFHGVRDLGTVSAH